MQVYHQRRPNVPKCGKENIATIPNSWFKEWFASSGRGYPRGNPKATSTVEASSSPEEGNNVADHLRTVRIAAMACSV